MNAKVIVPRPYQDIAVKAGLKALIAVARALVVMATGLGKTITAAMIAKKFRAKRVLFLVHNNFILDHAMDEFRLVFGEGPEMAIYNGRSKNGAENAQFVFATWQTMGEHLTEWSKYHFDLIIVDEAHHAEAETYALTARYFNGARLGITATPDRNDNEDIRNIFGQEVVSISLEEAIARGWLPKIEYRIVTNELDEDALQVIIREIRESRRRFTMAEVNRRLFIKKHERGIAKVITSYQQKGIVFCRSIEHSNRMAKVLSPARAFHSGKDKKCTTPKQIWDRNQKTLTDLRHERLRYVTAVNAFNEGVDVPSIGLVALCRQHGVLNTWQQQIGRGLRPGKDVLIVLDFVANLERMQLLLETIKRIQGFEEKYVQIKNRSKKLLDDEKEFDVGGSLDKRKTFEVSGAAFKFVFSQEVVDLMAVLKHCDRDFYPTWQEASVAAVAMGIKNREQYILSYKQDLNLPGNPRVAYEDFPGWDVFLSKLKNYYEKCSEASAAAQKLGIKFQYDYGKQRKLDPQLPSAPNVYYEDFPGWGVFLGKRNRNAYHKTWKIASVSARLLGATSRSQYDAVRGKDPLLPAAPDQTYKDFPGWVKFLGKPEVYKTLQEASAAARKLKIKTSTEYLKGDKRNKDPRLPGHPERHTDFVSWKHFLGR